MRIGSRIIVEVCRQDHMKWLNRREPLLLDPAVYDMLVQDLRREPLISNGSIGFWESYVPCHCWVYGTKVQKK